MSLTVFYTIRDADNDTSTISFQVDETAWLIHNDHAFLMEAAWDIINPLVNGQLVTAGFTWQVNVGDFTNAAAAVISDVQEKAEFVFEAVGGFIKRISLPTFIETFFTNAGAGKEVDITQAPVLAFIGLMEDGVPEQLVPVTPIPVKTDHGEDVTTFLEGHQSWGKRR